MISLKGLCVGQVFCIPYLCELEVELIAVHVSDSFGHAHTGTVLGHGVACIGSCPFQVSL